MMKLEIKTLSALPCGLDVFKINGKDANLADFGEMEHVEGNCMDGTCHYEFNRNIDPPSQKILKKYRITDTEYSKICDRLEDKLYVSGCGWCS